MKLVHTAYLELPASLAVVADLLRDPAAWPSPLADAERIGTFWRYKADLYQLIPAEPDPADPQRVAWTMTLPASGGAQVAIAVRLVDAAISTHLALRVTYHDPNLRWPWQALRVRMRIQTMVTQIHQALIAAVRAVPVHAPLSLAPVATLEDDDAALLATLSDDAPNLDALRERYPLTVEHFVAMNALDHLERVVRLEQSWDRMLRGEHDLRMHQSARLEPAPLDADLIYAGGGLGLLHAAVMAVCYGYRVLLFDRSEVGCAHREWNISREELQALVDLGLVDWNELASVVMREYRDGVVRFFNRDGSDVATGELWMPEVLNVALDAGALLRLMRRKLEAAGGRVLSGRLFRAVRVADSGPLQVEVELEDLAGGMTERYRGRMLLDGMGSTSPLALQRHAGRPFAGVCPTVGTVASGFAQGDAPDEYDPTLGDILVSVADAQRGEQLMWEGFPGRDDELTVYLFYYSTIETAGGRTPSGGLRADAPRYSLLDLFEQYFTLLPTYKRPGPDFQHIKPVYGYIPARHSLRAQEAPLLRGVVPVGDSAAQQSPLTFCGFGSHVRNLARTAGLLDQALRHELAEPAELAPINAFQTNVSLNWVFSRFMHPWYGADDVNRLQNIFLEVLEERGVAMATRFFRDQMRWGDYHPMILGVLRRYPMILAVSLRVLGVRGMVQWAGDYVHFSWIAAQAALARLAGPRVERMLCRLAGRVRPALALQVRARYAEWRAMGWL